MRRTRTSERAELVLSLLTDWLDDSDRRVSGCHKLWLIVNIIVVVLQEWSTECLLAHWITETLGD